MPYKIEKLLKLKEKAKKIILPAIFIAGLSFSFSLMNGNLKDFSASVIPSKTAAPFDGTVLPVEKVAKWTALTESERAMSYDELSQEKLIPLPVYNPDQLKMSADKLGWKSEQDLAIRNAKITYATPYMGDYKLDGLEYAGSHLAIDIKMPKNTPVHAIGNGVVVKVADQETGFGKHIVIKHENFPSLDDPNKKITLYSSYNHLNEILVSEGQVVTKGELIGKSGQTGLASTPHLHFQIDNDSAPWHPYWPFTGQEAAAAGVSFDDAVNTGLGKDKALKTTINPMLYVQKYLSSSASSQSVTSPSAPPVATPDQPKIDELPPKQDGQPALNNEVPPPPTDEGNHNSAPQPTPQPSPTPETSEIPETPSVEPVTAFTIEHDGSFVVGATEKMTIKAVDAKGNVVTTYKPEDRVYLKVTLGAANTPNSLSANDFQDGKAIFQVTPTSEVGLKIQATDLKISGESDVMASGSFTDLDENSSSYKAIQVLKKYGVIGGYPDGTFQPNRVVSRVEALKFIVKGTRLTLKQDKQLPFPDLKLSEWYGDYVTTAYKEKIIAGYPDKTFKPENTVSKAEFTKMLLLALNIPVPEKIEASSFKNISASDWFAPYFEVARQKNLLSEDNGASIDPKEGMTREEVAAMIYRAVMLKASGTETYDNNKVVAGTKLNKYFEVY